MLKNAAFLGLPRIRIAWQHLSYQHKVISGSTVMRVSSWVIVLRCALRVGSPVFALGLAACGDSAEAHMELMSDAASATPAANVPSVGSMGAAGAAAAVARTTAGSGVAAIGKMDSSKASAPAAQSSSAGPAARSAPASASGTSSSGAKVAQTDDSNASGSNAGSAAAGMLGPASVTPGPDGFPKDEPMNVEQMGPYQFMSYTDGLENPAYSSSVMYYPVDAQPPFSAAVFSPGFTAVKENYENFLGPLMASHGMCILLTTPTTTGDIPQQRGEDLQAAIMQIATENQREGSPLKGKLDPKRVCVTGHSMGGGGTMWAANALGDAIKCAVPLQPWQPGSTESTTCPVTTLFPMVKAPIMFIAGQSDAIAAPASNAQIFYASIPDGVPKYYVEFAGASHFLTTNDLGTAYDVQSRYMIAFYKRYLEDDPRYQSVLDAMADPALSMYEHSP